MGDIYIIHISTVSTKGGEMFYLGHFSFVEHDEGKLNHGFFTAVAEAEDIDNATVKLHSLLDRKQKETDLFEKQTFIFLEDIIEIKKIPEHGFIAHYSHYEGESTPFISRSIPDMPGETCESYRPYPEFENSDSRDEVDIVPFITFEG